jgi:hypothetical protein
VNSNLKPGKDSGQPSSYQPICLLDTIVKLFEKILLPSFLYEVGECWLTGDKQHNMSLQLVHMVGGIFRHFGESRLTGVVFLDVATAFDTIRFDCLLYKLTILISRPTYLTPSHRTFWFVLSWRSSGNPRHLVTPGSLEWSRVV